jgi:hypothetical protein
MSVRRTVCVFALITVAAFGCSKGNQDDGVKTVAPDAVLGDAPSAKDDEEVAKSQAGGPLQMPEKGGLWPWSVGSAPALEARAPVSLTSFIVPGRTIHGAIVNSAAARGAVFLNDWVEKKSPSFTHLLWCDLTRGQVIGQCDIKDMYLPFDMHGDGRRLLARRSDAGGRGAQGLELWSMGPGDKIDRKTFHPYWKGTSADGESRGDPDPPNFIRKEAEVRWAGFVGRDHIASVTGNGELKIWALNTLKQVAVFPGVVGMPGVTCDCAKLAFVTDRSVALYDPAVNKIVGARPIGKPPLDAVLAFHPDGKLLAIGGTGRIILLDLATGQSWDAMVADLKLNYHGLLPDFGWAGTQHVYHNGSLYDLNTPIPVWQYSWQKWAMPRGREVWMIAQRGLQKEVALLSFVLPHPNALAQIEEALRQPGLFALRPGDDVRVDVSGLPTDRQKEIKQVLEGRAKLLGYRLNSAATVVFEASEDKRSTPRSITYSFSGAGSRTYKYDERKARLKIVKAGRAIWETAGCQEPPILLVAKGSAPPTEAPNWFGDPDFDLFTKRPIPGVIRGDANKKALGTTDVAADGLHDRQ